MDRVQDEKKLIPFLNAIKQVGVSRNTALRHIEGGIMPEPIRLGSKLFFNALSWGEWIDSGCKPVGTGWQPRTRSKSRS